MSHTIQSSHSSSFLPVRPDSIGHQLFLFCQPVWPPLPQYLIHIVHLHTPTQLLLPSESELYHSCGCGFYFLILGCTVTWNLSFVAWTATKVQYIFSVQYELSSIHHHHKFVCKEKSTVTYSWKNVFHQVMRAMQYILVESWNNKQLHSSTAHILTLELSADEKTKAYYVVQMHMSFSVLKNPRCFIMCRRAVNKNIHCINLWRQVKVYVKCISK